MTAFSILASLRPRVSSRHRCIRHVGVCLGLCHSAPASFHRHAAVGDGEEVRSHDAGAVPARPLGMLLHRHADFFTLTAVMLVPYIIIGVMGGGQTLQAISYGKVP